MVVNLFTAGTTDLLFWFSLMWGPVGLSFMSPLRFSLLIIKYLVFFQGYADNSQMYCCYTLRQERKYKNDC